MENENNVNLETTNEEVQETVETPAEETKEETLETPEVDTAQLQATNKKLFERAKKAEAELKALKGANQVAKPSQTSPQTIEETVLQAQGMPDELIESLRKVAQVEGIGSLIKAQTNPIFVAVKEKFERELKQKQASMPASRNSGATRPQKSLTTPGLSREEHRKLALEKLA
jgi:hypothetical protein